MRKIFLSALFIFLSLQCAKSMDYKDYCASKPEQKTVQGKLSGLSGINFISTKIIEHEISKKLKQELDADFDIKIKSIYGGSILNGEFESLTAESKKVNFNDFYLSNIKAYTVCEYNHVDFKNKKLKFSENFVLKYSSQITQDDLDKTVESGAYKKIIDKINDDKLVSSMLKITESRIEIQDNELKLIYILSPFSGFIRPFKLNLSGNLEAQDGKIKLVNIHLVSKKKYHIPDTLLDILNPLDYNVKISKNKKANLSVEDVKISDNIINIAGYLIVEKD